MTLPKTLLALMQILREEGGVGFSPPVKHPNSKSIHQYSVPGLHKGRPLDRVMIVLAGESGAGKSSTINRLFEDELCPVSNTKSETSNVIQYLKDLNVGSVDPKLSAILCFVDVPGSLDTDSSREEINTEKILSFRRNHPALKDRFVPDYIKVYDIPSTVEKRMVD